METYVVESTESETESSHENSLNFEEIDASTERYKTKFRIVFLKNFFFVCIFVLISGNGPYIFYTFYFNHYFFSTICFVKNCRRLLSFSEKRVFIFASFF